MPIRHSTECRAGLNDGGNEFVDAIWAVDTAGAVDRGG
jgi:hypothetical protein